METCRNKTTEVEFFNVMPVDFHRGFLGTAAPLCGDALLFTEIAMGLMLLLGSWLARTRKFKWHAVCQSAIVLLNAAVIVTVMLPAFRTRVVPKLPARLARPHYLISTIHAALGTVAETAGIYVLLSPGPTYFPSNSGSATTNYGCV